MIDIVDTFFSATIPPNQAQLDWLIKRQGVPPLAIARDPGEIGFVIGTAYVDLDELLFEFAEPVENGDKPGERAIVFVARDRWGSPIDLIAWLPKNDRVTAFYGRAAILGESSIFAPRLSVPLAVHRSPLGWLKAGREGIVIVDRKRAWRQLDGVKLIAEDIDHGLDLRKALTPPSPSIVVPAISDAARCAA